MSRIHDAFVEDTTRVRRQLTGIVLMAAPVVSALSIIVGVDHTENNGRQLDIIRAHAGQFTAMVILEYVTWVFIAMGLVGLVGLVRRRGAVLAHVAAGLGIVGAAGFLAGWGPMMLPLSRMTDRAAALDAIDHMGVLYQLGAALSGFLMVGLVLGFVAAWRASVIPGWCVGVGVVGLVLLSATGDARGINLLGLAILAVPMTRLGTAIFRGERTEEDAVPVFEPVAAG
jgi:hypothetical protein